MIGRLSVRLLFLLTTSPPGPKDLSDGGNRNQCIAAYNFDKK